MNGGEKSCQRSNSKLHVYAYVVAGLDPGRDLRVGDELGEEDLPVSEDEVAAAGNHAPLGEHDQRRALPEARI